jgi:hypothetical protein
VSAGTRGLGERFPAPSSAVGRRYGEAMRRPVAQWKETRTGGSIMTDTKTSTQATCPDCRAVVADLAAHELWHLRLVGDLARAVEQEIGAKLAAAR